MSVLEDPIGERAEGGGARQGPRRVGGEIKLQPVVLPGIKIQFC